MTGKPLEVESWFGAFASALLAAELPELPAERRKATVEFVCTRARSVPAPLRVGLIALVVATGVVRRRVGAARTVTFLRRTTLPLVGELARMVRSLAFTFVWETWPDTAPTGAPARSDA